MAIFKTSGFDAESRPFQVRFEAPNQEALTNFAAQSGLTITRIKKIPFSWFPFFKSPLSFFAFFLLLPAVLITFQDGLSLFIHRVTQYSYLQEEMPYWQKLITEGKQGNAVITDVELKSGGKTSYVNTYFYTYEISNPKKSASPSDSHLPEGSLAEIPPPQKYTGKITRGATSLLEGRFDRDSLIDLNEDELEVHQTIPILYLPDNPTVHAPFKDGEKIQEALYWLKPLVLVRVGSIVLVVSFTTFWLIYNFLLRIGNSTSIDSSHKIWILYRREKSIPAMGKQKSRKRKGRKKDEGGKGMGKETDITIGR